MASRANKVDNYSNYTDVSIGKSAPPVNLQPITHLPKMCLPSAQTNNPELSHILEEDSPLGIGTPVMYRNVGINTNKQY